jgi:hypothetical protein
VAIDTGRADPREHVSGVMWAPGDRARTRAQRLRSGSGTATAHRPTTRPGSGRTGPTGSR